MEIRQAATRDVKQIAQLLEQLGYPTTIERLHQRIKVIEAHPNHDIFVCETQEGIVGMIGLNTGLFYVQDGSYVQISALVVDQNHRGQGIGKKLLEEAEQWADKKGAAVTTLNIDKHVEHRTPQQFYTKMGYERESIFFSKKLTEPPHE
ncbi:ribosomal protein S18 acetylase RimI-like enzyme [Salsuginibacillus halophilus]|uniref:Ribosomal protein S18 acetylase RimI-like enzyme n=1 Tax=Salsuginibacillus halophilus TaxID=517424 RepID=A0A2P8HAK0_9BACI|nr:GNAT family N-acetyltransferase [Salsuginibacillus halophilus]PSL43234.1 ribosomal protein S18 acetylase RimI-like enzyme [Salsuginibacillus halophilus]